MSKFLCRFFLLLLFTVCSLPFTNFVFAKTIDEEISEISKQIADLEKAMAPLKTESTSLAAKISQAKVQITKTENQITGLTQRLIEKEADLEIQKTLMFERIRRHYKNTKNFNPLLIILASPQSSNILRQYSWYQAVISQDKSLITRFGSEISTLNLNKTNLEKEKVKLATLKKTMESRFGFLTTEIKKAEAHKQALSARQQQLIAEKTAMFNTSVGDVSTSDDPASRSDYNPGFSPAFAAFSFGAPHRKGMSQFGAFGRAKAGQSAEQILKAYYGDIRLETVDMPGSIKTTVGTLPFEDNYLIGIAEMPAKWGDEGGFEALKAQAIAARTYALNSTGWSMNSRNSTGTICVTEACQVYKRSRFDNPGRWRQAVQDTRGKVVVSSKTGNIFSAFYASTAGGSSISFTSNDHSVSQIWDTSCGSQSCWPGNAYEKSAGSGWFYKGWYKTRSNTSCGRSHPWLNQSEFSDIANAVLYYSKTSDSAHLSQYDNGGCFGGRDPSSWSSDELRRQVADKGGPVSSVNSVSVDYSTGGYTQKVRLSTDKGDFNFDGDDFKQIFTLRAPGAITLKSSLFNIEKK